MKKFFEFIQRIEPTASKVRFYLYSLSLTVFAVVWVLAHHSNIEKALKAPMLKTLVEIRSSDGQMLGRIRANLEGKLLTNNVTKLNEIAPEALAAVLLSEDKRFYSHIGIDPIATLSAATSLSRGASVIEAQLARGQGLTFQETPSDKAFVARFGALGRVLTSFPRKVDETIFALLFNIQYSKNELLYWQMNTWYWGGSDDPNVGIYGIGAAAQAYFGIDAAKLSAAQGFYLSALLTAPATHYNNFTRARAGMKQRLKNFVRGNFLTQQQADAIWLEKIQPKGWQITYATNGEVTQAKRIGESAVALYRPLGDLGLDCFFDTISEGLKKQYNTLPEGLITVETTLDSRLQKAARLALDTGLTSAQFPSNGEMSMTAVDPNNGEVRVLTTTHPCSQAMTENDSSANEILRNPASTIKPLLLATAIENNAAQPWSLFTDSPMRGYNIQNYSGTFTSKKMMLREALNRSLNLPFLRLALTTGFDRIQNQLTKLGMSVPNNLNAANIIGGGEDGVTNLQLSLIYASFANGGVLYEPTLIRSITITPKNAKPMVVYTARANSTNVWTTETAYTTLNMLCGVLYDPARINSFLARGAKTVPNVCGKTGSSGTPQAAYDFWFAGVTPNLAGAIWIGNRNNEALIHTSNSGFNAALYGEFLTEAQKAGVLPTGSYDRPPSIVAKQVGGIWMAATAQ